jgi:hypothetical protein
MKCMLFWSVFVGSLMFLGCGGDGPAPALDATADTLADTATEVVDDVNAHDADTEDDVGLPDAAGDTMSDTPEPDTAPDIAMDIQDDADVSDTTEPSPGWLETLATPADFDALRASGDEVKYLARIDGREPPAAIAADCLFQDMGRWAWHIEFLRTFDGLSGLTGAQYAGLVLNRITRSLWGGGLVWRANTLHPLTGARGIHAWSVYGEARPGSITATDIIEVHGRLSTCAPFAATTLVFVASGAEQQQMLQSAREQLAEMGIATLAQ